MAFEDFTVEMTLSFPEKNIPATHCRSKQTIYMYINTFLEGIFKGFLNGLDLVFF